MGVATGAEAGVVTFCQAGAGPRGMGLPEMEAGRGSSEFEVERSIPMGVVTEIPDDRPRSSKACALVRMEKRREEESVKKRASRSKCGREHYKPLLYC